MKNQARTGNGNSSIFVQTLHDHRLIAEYQCRSQRRISINTLLYRLFFSLFLLILIKFSGKKDHYESVR
jgi:hypothetical protein